MYNIDLSVLHISWAYQILDSKTADNRGPTVTFYYLIYMQIVFTRGDNLSIRMHLNAKSKGHCVSQHSRIYCYFVP